MPQRGTDLLLNTVWRATAPPDPEPSELAAALSLAQRNQVVAPLARAYPWRLVRERRAIEAATRDFRQGLREASRRLAAASIRHTSIEAGASEVDLSGHFNIVVREADWEAAIDALRPTAAWISAHPNGRDTLLIQPRSGPAVHLHRSLSWLDVGVLAADDLDRRATPAAAGPWLVPDPADVLLIRLAHVAFQTLELTLADALCFRDQRTQPLLQQAAERAAAGGWGAGFLALTAAARDLVDALDAGEAPLLPRPLPVTTSYRVGAEHAASTWSARRRRAAVRELLLRPGLVVAERRRTVTRRARAAVTLRPRGSRQPTLR